MLMCMQTFTANTVTIRKLRNITINFWIRILLSSRRNNANANQIRQMCMQNTLLQNILYAAKYIAAMHCVSNTPLCSCKTSCDAKFCTYFDTPSYTFQNFRHIFILHTYRTMKSSFFECDEKVEGGCQNTCETKTSHVVKLGY